VYSPKPHLERTIGLIGAVALVVGAVIGAGIYALIGVIAAKAGDATWLAFVCAVVVSLIGAVPVIQVASAMPRAGAGYVFASRMLFPMAGTVTSGTIVAAGACSTALAMLALSTYLPPWITFGAPPYLIAIAILAGVYVVMLFGMQLAIGLQIVMVAQKVIALGIYCVAGAAATKLHFGFEPRGGTGAFFTAVVLCYNSCMGFQVLAEMGEEIKDAKRNIPLALLIGGVVFTAIYIVIGAVLVGSLPYSPENYDPEHAPLSASALLFLPAPIVAFVNLGSLTAALTSLNAGAMALPRELYAQSRDGILPAVLSRVSRRSHGPVASVTAFFAIVIALVLLHLDQEFYGLMAAVGIQTVTAVLCIAALRLKARYPERYRGAYINCPSWLLWACTVTTVIVTVGFVAIMASERPIVVVIYGILGVSLAVYHAVRVAYLRRIGHAYAEIVRQIPGDEEVQADAAPALAEQESEA